MKRKSYLTQLPSVHQTKTLQKFFNATVDQVFSPGETERIDGFIGRIPSYNNPEIDFYKIELTKERQKYQLEPSMTTRDMDGFDELLFYPDLVNKLHMQGSIVDNHNRLFENDFYSWCPPINIDKLTRYRDYFWLPEGPPVMMFTLNFLDLEGDGENNNPLWAGYVSDGVRTRFPLPTPLPGMVIDYAIHRNGIPFIDDGVLDGNINDGTVVDGNIDDGIIIDGNNSGSYRIEDNIVIFDEPFPHGDLIEVWNNANFKQNIIGKENFTFPGTVYGYIEQTVDTPYGKEKKKFGPTVIANPPSLKVGMLVEISDNNGTVLYEVVRVNGLLDLVETEGFRAVSSEVPMYITIESDAENNNRWSRMNRWYHKDFMFYSSPNYIPLQAVRPIIEFSNELEIINHGRFDAGYVNAYWDSSTESPQKYVNNAYESLMTIPSGIHGIDFPEPGQSYETDIRILIFDSSDPTEKNKILTGRVVVSNMEYDGGSTSNWDRSPFDLWEKGYKLISLDSGSSSPNANEYDSVALKDTELSWYFNGNEWNENQYQEGGPLFELYDIDDRRLSDIDDEFKGSKIFEYLNGSTYDNVLKFDVSHNKYGSFEFKSSIATDKVYENGEEIKGLKFYNRITSYIDKRESVWQVAGVTVQTKDSDGLYDIPLNLQANPLNEEVTIISANEWNRHFKRIRELNDWTLSSNQFNLSVGRQILQHRSPLLKTMLLCADDNLSLPKAITYSQKEYVRFKGKFINLINQTVISENDNPNVVVDAILSQLNAVKMPDFPFYKNGMINDEQYIPATASYLGAAPLYKPSMVVMGGKYYILGHDGSITTGTSIDSNITVRDNTILTLETRIYNSVLPSVRNKRVPIFDINRYVSGRFRTSDYSREEYLEVSRQAFEKWCITSGYQYRENNIYVHDDPFTWNYSYLKDIFGNELPGYWRGIYQWYYDTDKPDTNPWEMMGYKIKPSFWDNYYSWTDPVKRSNLINDIKLGVINPATGEVDPTYARSEFDKVVPVDTNGVLLDPFAAGIVADTNNVGVNSPWKYGDGAPVENMWKTSSFYNFDLALFGYLLKPVRFVESNWVSGGEVFKLDQWVNDFTNDRTQSRSEQVHGENNIKNIGIQTWISDLIKSNGASIIDQFGNKIRTINVNLASKIGGYVESDSIVAFTENSGLVPQENTNIALYKSPTFRTEFYSGVIVEWSGRGWRVIGYDILEPFFNIHDIVETGNRFKISLGQDLPPVHDWLARTHYTSGIFVLYKNTTYRCTKPHVSGPVFEQRYWEAVSIGNAPQSVTWYSEHVEEITKIPYGYEFVTIQEVVNFLSGYQKYLINSGWLFDKLNGLNEINDFKTSARELLAWSQNNWDIGTFIALSPTALSSTFKTDYGTIEKIDQKFDGIYSITNKYGTSISSKNIFTNREDNLIEVNSKEGMFGIRVCINEIEQALIFDNKTIFNDDLYVPLFNSRQYRLRMSMLMSTDWVGRYDAPGFVISEDKIMPSFDKQTENIRTMYDIELPSTKTYREMAQHQFGYQNRTYLQEMLYNDINQFEFYQGMIQQKGTLSVFEKLMRSNRLTQNRSINFLEEWAFRKDIYGGTEVNDIFEFTLTKDELKQDPQMIQDVLSYSNAVDIAGNWIIKPEFMFQEDMDYTRSNNQLRSAGFCRSTDVEWQGMDIRSVSDQIDYLNSDLEEEERLWFYDLNGRWSVNRAVKYSSVPNEIVQYVPTFKGTDLRFKEPTNFIVGDLIYLSLLAKQDDVRLFGIHNVTYVSPDGLTVRIDTEVVEEKIYKDNINTEDDPIPEERPFILKLESCRYTSNSASLEVVNRVFNTTVLNPLDMMELGINPSEYKENELIYIDMYWDLAYQHLIPKFYIRWGVFKKVGNNFRKVRTQPKRILSDRIQDVKVFNNQTKLYGYSINQKPLITDDVVIYSPIDNMFPGVAMTEIDIILSQDPALYNNNFGDYEGINWGSEQLGRRWWDVSKVRFIDSRTNADVDEEESDYRVNYFGQIAPGTEIAIYEWVKSSKRPEEISFVQVSEWNEYQGKMVEVYYHWERAPKFSQSPNRYLSAFDVQEILKSPAKAGISFISPMDEHSFIISGFTNILTSYSSIQIKIRRSDNIINTHTEWELMREGDERSMPTSDIWNRFIFSMTGSNKYGNKIPFNDLPSSSKYGFDVDGGQSIFRDLKSARAGTVEFINKHAKNRMIIQNSTTIDKLTGTDGYTKHLQWAQRDGSYFIQPLPSEKYYDYKSNDISDLVGDTLVYSFKDSDYFWSVMDINGNIKDRYDIELSTIAELKANQSTYPTGTLIKVNGNSETSGFWTVWEIKNSKAYLFDHQKFNSADAWERIDWLEDDSLVEPKQVVNTVIDRDVLVFNNPNVKYVKIRDDGTGYWIWTLKVDDEWRIVAKEKATIKLKDKIVNNTGNMIIDNIGIEINNINFVEFKKSIENRDMGLEINKIMNGIREGVFDDSYVNQMIFDIVHYVHTENDYVDWCFKTSFLYLTGITDNLSQSPIAYTDITNNLLDYVNEVKPYHVKVRDFVSSYGLQTEVANFTAYDFDKPAYLDQVTGKTRILDINVPTDVEIMKNGIWKYWYEDYMGERKKIRSLNMTIMPLDVADFHLVETAKISIHREEVTIDPNYGWDVVSYDNGHLYDFDYWRTNPEYTERYHDAANWGVATYGIFEWDNDILSNPRIIARKFDDFVSTNNVIEMTYKDVSNMTTIPMVELDYNCDSYVDGIWEVENAATTFIWPI